MFRVKLGNHPHGGLKLHQRILADIRQRSVRTHPGGSGGGVDGEDTLPRVEEVGGVAGDLKGGEGSRLHMLGDGAQNVLGVVVEKLDLSPVSE